MVLPIFNCSQPNLISTCRLIWQTCLNRIDVFSAEDPSFNAALIEENIALIKTAERIPDFATRNATTSLWLLKLDKSKEAVIRLSKFLTIYMERTFTDADELKLQNKAAGFDYLAKLKNYNSNAVNQFLSSAIPFIEANKGLLTTKGRMTTTFLAECQAAENVFNDTLANYNTANTAAKASTDEKNTAYNEVYTRAQKVLKVGRDMNIDAPEIAKTYLFSAFLAQIESPSNAALAGLISQGTKKQPISGVRITIKDTDKVFETASDGRFDISPLSMGIYMVTIEKEGFETQTIEVEIKTGVTTRLNVVLVPKVVV